ncbi:MAG: hypothetical protein KBI46_06375 [Phycisphaerae bacterium]|nr:hypothetical protein [Phycisphaerae bacterium]
MMPLWTESQRWPWFLSLILLSGTVVLAAVVVLLILTTELLPSAKTILGIAGLAAALLDILLASLRLVSEVYPDRIEIYFAPLHFPCRKIGWDEIEKIYARQYSPVAEYGGWGIRCGKSGGAYNIKGNQGIQIELKNGRKFLVGTQQPDAFMQAVKSVCKQAAD